MSELDDLRARYWELIEERDAIREEAEPVIAEMAVMRGQICELQAQLKPLKAKRKEIEGKGEDRLYQLDRAIAALSKGLGNKAGERPQT